jgi:hypothetical protein
MRIALVDSMPRAKLYPVSLLKIGSWRKSMGDDCVLFKNKLPPAGEFDEIWITTIFTFDIPHALGIVREGKRRAKVVKVGGVSATLLPEYFEKEGVEVYKGLLPEAEEYPPDYSLLGITPEYSISHTSRGCVRKCGFCMVTKLEPKFEHQADWEADIHPDAKKILFYDNNWLAKPRSIFKEDVNKLHRLVKSGRITEIDFNQGLDARLITEDIAGILKGLPIRPVRFAFDGMQEDKHYQRAVRLMFAHGFTEFVTYVLYNFMDTPQDFYYRLRESVLLSDELKTAVKSFPMRYQPILEADAGRRFVGKHWTERSRRGYMTILASHYVHGVVASAAYNSIFPPIKEFEYWFGKDSDEFIKLINYPKIKELCLKKTGDMRMQRARAKMIRGVPELVARKDGD